MVFIKKKKCSTVGLHGINIFECSTAAKPKKKAPPLILSFLGYGALIELSGWIDATLGSYIRRGSPMLLTFQLISASRSVGREKCVASPKKKIEPAESASE